MEDKNDKPIIDYFELKNDVRDFSDAIFIEDKVKSGLKVTGKALFNVGLCAGKIGVSFAKELPTLLEEQAKKQKLNKDEK